MARTLYAKHKEQGSASFSALFNKCKHAAKQRNLIFSLSREEHKILIIQNCHYCDRPPAKYNSYLKNKGLDQVRPNRYGESTIERNWICVNGIDRVDNKEGYEVSNCLPCCSICNYLKCDMTYKDFILWIKTAYNHLLNKGVL